MGSCHEKQWHSHEFAGYAFCQHGLLQCACSSNKHRCGRKDKVSVHCTRSTSCWGLRCNGEMRQPCQDVARFALVERCCACAQLSKGVWSEVHSVNHKPCCPNIPELMPTHVAMIQMQRFRIALPKPVMPASSCRGKWVLMEARRRGRGQHYTAGSTAVRLQDCYQAQQSLNQSSDPQSTASPAAPGWLSRTAQLA